MFRGQLFCPLHFADSAMKVSDKMLILAEKTVQDWKTLVQDREESLGPGKYIWKIDSDCKSSHFVSICFENMIKRQKTSKIYQSLEDCTDINSMLNLLYFPSTHCCDFHRFSGQTLNKTLVSTLKKRS